MDGMLRIGQLASYVGVSTRTVRFYHQAGLLPEPERNAAGYRLYDAEAVLQLTRIVTLASAGVPLARIHDLLAASDEAFAAELVEIDMELRDRIRRLKDDRSRLTRLRAGDALVLPDVLARLIEHLRSAGVDRAEVDHYRDVWILIHALYADQLERWLRHSTAMLEDPDYRRNLVRTFQVARLEPDAPEVAQLAADSVEWILANRDTRDSTWLLSSMLDDPLANELLQSQWADHPALTRLGELTMQGLRERGVDLAG